MLKRVAVAGDHPHRQVGPAGFQAGGHGRRTAVDRVDAVGVHVIGKAAGAADARDEHDLFRRHAERRQALFSSGPGSSNRRSPGTSGRPDRWQNPAAVKTGKTVSVVMIVFLLSESDFDRTCCGGLRRQLVGLVSASQQFANLFDDFDDA